MAQVVAVARDSGHRFAKALCSAIRLVAGLGVEGDAHCGATVPARVWPGRRGRAADGSLVRKAGVMAVVIEGGEIHPGDRIAFDLPAVHEPLLPV